MQIVAEKLGKRFNLEWIFRNLDLNFQDNISYAITGSNGSGKSTLLQILLGIMPYSEGKIIYSNKDKSIIPAEDIYKHISIAAPYQELIEELTLSEHIDFHLKFKKFKSGISKETFIETLNLKKSSHKEIRFFSSGMKQRVKLGLAIYTDSPILLLDEPTTNLDNQGADWYREEIQKSIKNRLVIICSNQRQEYDFCDEVIPIKK